MLWKKVNTTMKLYRSSVNWIFCVRREICLWNGLAYIWAQVIGAVIGTFVAHLMFELPIIQISETVRSGPAQWWAEIVATFGLLAAIFGGLRFKPEAVPALVGLYITAAYWFTASTSFANPAVAIGRAFSDTFAGIRPADLPGFITAEVIGAMLAVLLFGWLFRSSDPAQKP